MTKKYENLSMDRYDVDAANSKIRELEEEKNELKRELQLYFEDATACDMINSLTSQFTRIERLFNQIIQTKNLEVILATIKQESEIFEDSGSWQTKIAILHKVFQKMEAGLLARKEIMKNNNLEESYQQNKQNN